MPADRRQFLKVSTLAAGACLLGIHPASGQDAAVHIVRPGETLDQIARKYGTTAEAIRRANDITGDLILAGQSLKLPADAPAVSRTYTVRRGDTLGKIARNHGVSLDQIKSANNLTSDLIHPGQQLLIPGSGGTAPAHRYIGNVVTATNRLHVRPGRWRYIIGHHSAVNTGNAEIYDRFHRRQMRMPNGLAYHFVIGNGSDSGDGEVEVGSRWTGQIQGGHVRNLRINEIGIGICLVGNFEKRRPTQAQIAAFIELVHYLKNEVVRGPCEFAVHREIDGQRTLCPGRLFPAADMHRRFS